MSGASSQQTNDAIRVMVVDDALVIRGMLTRFLEESGDISVVASVGDGERALAALDRHDVDVVVLDIEMPRMDGLTALPKIIEKVPGIQVLMASTLTLRNAEVSLKAMSLGAADYVPKPSSTGELRSRDDFKRDLIEKVRTLGRVGRRRRLRRERQEAVAGTSGAARARRDTLPETKRVTPAKPVVLRPMKTIHPEIIAIGSSTGGPQALFRVLKDLPAALKQPIVITQHMPPTFTTILAEHVARASGRPSKEAEDGDVLQPGHIYIAPGDYHMLITKDGIHKKIRLTQDPPENFCRPAVDPMLRSLVESYGGSKILAVILTGMGADGSKGAKVVVDDGGVLIAQDEESSVVWGMPGAVATAGLCSAVLPILEIGPKIKSIALGGSA
nr:chemotaxis response regulator protein-glutamate methylesterase [Aestuariispira ectoiniformans]